MAKTHGEQRLGILTSSQASVIMHGSLRAWESLSKRLWTEDAGQFDHSQGTPAMRYGHEHEAEGAAKFWERHPEVERMLSNQFYTRGLRGVPLGSSPDRVLVLRNLVVEGLEIKSPTRADMLDAHLLRHHRDQCQHGLLVTRFPVWHLYVFFGDEFRDTEVLPDKNWQRAYAKRAKAFWKFHTTGETP